MTLFREVKRCRKCNTELKPGETFCPSCGNKVVLSALDLKRRARSISMKYIKQTHRSRIQSGRSAIFIVAVLNLLGALVFYAVGKNELSRTENVLTWIKSDSDFDTKELEEAEEEVRKANDVLMLIFLVQLSLTALYLGLWYWAKTNPLPASLIALLLFLAMWGLSAMLEPRNLIAGVVINLIIAGVLFNAVTSAYKYRKMVESHV